MSEPRRQLIPLPIDPSIPKIVESLESHSALVLQAAPGSGKTTRVPPALYLAKFRKSEQEILVLEPRRLAAKMAARRVADEMGEEVGETVGYQFRFENVGSARTRIRFVTEGMLMRRMLGDPELKSVAAVLLDEFHERHLHGDVALAALRNLQRSSRPDLKLVVMSATLDTQAISKYLGDCPVIQVEGRMYDVTVEYLSKPPEKYLDQTVREAVVNAVGTNGDILVFLPGMAEIRRSAIALEPLAQKYNLAVLPLHGELSKEEQDRALSRASKTKVILSTNVAETSLTIPGITTVIDSGLVRSASYSWWSGLPALSTKPISKASAIQRSGRAGRTAPGRCFRLYTKHDFETRPGFEIPEIQRADLAQTVLELKTLGVGDLSQYPWFESPSKESLDSAQTLLFRLGVLDSAVATGKITGLGKTLSEMPVHPRLARVVFEGARRGVLNDAASLAALLSESGLMPGDILQQLRNADPKIRDRLMRSIRMSDTSRGNFQSPGAKEDALRISLLTGYPDRVAKKRVVGPSVEAQIEVVFSGGGAATIENSPLISTSDYFVALDVEEKKRLGQARSQIQVRTVSPIEPEWLLDLEPSGVRETDEFSWNDSRERVEARSLMLYDQLVLNESVGNPQVTERSARYLAETLLSRYGWDKISDSESLRNLGVRLELLRLHEPTLEVPILSHDYLKMQLIEVCRGLQSLEEVQSVGFLSFIESGLGETVTQKLERGLPSQIQLKRGRRVKVNYESGKSPWVESRLQDFFGMNQGPTLLHGKLPVTIHLLAPNQRAVQVTSDLKGFWERHYPTVRKELSRRYPRHQWPEDPLA